MSAERYVVLGLASVRSPWFRDVARWSTAAAIPVEFIKAVSIEEIRVRLRSGRAFSALLVDDTIADVDRDLIELARDAGCALIVVSSGRVQRDWSELGAAGVLPAELSREELVELLDQVARPIARTEPSADALPAPDVACPSWRGRLVTITGGSGTGRSTLAMALAQGLAADPRDVDLVCLADLALDADQGMLHDCPDVVPGVLELVDAHRAGVPAIEETRGLTWRVEGRGYQVLLGLRRHRDWTALRPRAFEAALDGLRRCFRTVVADVDADVEGEDECGSLDVEERNLMARTACRRADLVVVVGTPDVLGLRHLLRVLGDVRQLGVDDERVLPLVNRAPRSPRARAEITRAIAELAGAAQTQGQLPSPAFAPDRRRLDDSVRAGMPLPTALAAAIARPVRTMLERPGAATRDRARQQPDAGEPVPVTPGSLGSWTDEHLG